MQASPRLLEGDAEVDRVAGLAVQAQARPNPTASVFVENFVGSRPYAELGGQTTFQIDQALELGGKRGARIAAGQATLEATRAERVQSRLTFAVDLASRYAQTEALAQRVDFASEARDLAQEDLRVARLLVETGREAGLRSVQAEAEVAAANARLDNAKAESAAAYAELSAMAATAQPITSIPHGLLASADEKPIPPPIETVTSPAYQAALAEREAASKRVRVERLQATPNLTVSAGVRQVGRNDVGGGGGPFHSHLRLRPEPGGPYRLPRRA